MLIASAAIALYDIKTKTVPDYLSAIVISTGIVFHHLISFVNTWNAIFGALMGFIIAYELYLKFENSDSGHKIGMGDVKLISAYGAWLGVVFILPLYYFSWIMTLLIIKFYMKKYKKEQYISLPHAPSIVAVSLLLLYPSLLLI